MKKRLREKVGSVENNQMCQTYEDIEGAFCDCGYYEWADGEKGFLK